MITRRTKVQLLIFALITVLGVSYVGARYAKLDRIFRDDSYTVVAHFQESGGIFAGAEVTYRGVGVGRVDTLSATEDGVDVTLEIDHEYDEIPSDTKAIVGNRSAVGEQYVELQPQADDGPYLDEDGEIPVEMTETPIQTDVLLTNLSNLVNSVDREALRTTVDEFGKAFAGSGQDLQTIIDSGNSFLRTADENFDVTTKLIEDSNIVLNGQLASESSIRTFANQLSLFSTSLAGADPDLRAVLEDGSFAANQLKGFLEENRIELGTLLSRIVTTGEIIVKRLPGIEQILVLYPYVVEGGFTVASKDPDTDLYDAHFGLVLQESPRCTQGYGDIREPQDRFGNPPMNMDVRCASAPPINSRGSQNAPPRVGADYGPIAATFDPATGDLAWGDHTDGLTSTGSVAPRSLGEESWKWLYLQPMMQ